MKILLYPSIMERYLGDRSSYCPKLLTRYRSDNQTNHSDYQSSSTSHLPSPKSSKLLTYDTILPGGNNILHNFVLDNSDPNPSGSANYINAVLLSMSQHVSACLLNGLNADGFNALHLAVMKNNLIIVKQMLSCFPNIFDTVRCSKEGNTALHLAAKFGHSSIVQELLERKLNVKSLNRALYTPPKLAVVSGDLETVRIFVGNGCIDLIEGMELLQLAARMGKLNIVTFLMASGVYVNYKSRDGDELICRAAGSGDLRIVEFFLRNGCNVNARDIMCLTPLHYAVYSQSLQVVKFLVTNGANVNSNYGYQGSPLHCAVNYKNLEIAEFLLSSGADVNSKNIDQNTPLHCAVYNRNLEIINFLIRNGADVYAKNKDQNTPLSL